MKEKAELEKGKTCLSYQGLPEPLLPPVPARDEPTLLVRLCSPLHSVVVSWAQPLTYSVWIPDLPNYTAEFPKQYIPSTHCTFPYCLTDSDIKSITGKLQVCLFRFRHLPGPQPPWS